MEEILEAYTSKYSSIEQSRTPIHGVRDFIFTTFVAVCLDALLREYCHKKWTKNGERYGSEKH